MSYTWAERSLNTFIQHEFQRAKLLHEPMEPLDELVRRWEALNRAKYARRGKTISDHELLAAGQKFYQTYQAKLADYLRDTGKRSINWTLFPAGTKELVKAINAVLPDEYPADALLAMGLHKLAQLMIERDEEYGLTAVEKELLRERAEAVAAQLERQVPVARLTAQKS